MQKKLAHTTRQWSLFDFLCNAAVFVSIPLLLYFFPRVSCWFSSLSLSLLFLFFISPQRFSISDFVCVCVCVCVQVRVCSCVCGTRCTWRLGELQNCELPVSAPSSHTRPERFCASGSGTRGVMEREGTNFHHRHHNHTQRLRLANAKICSKTQKKVQFSFSSLSLTWLSFSLEANSEKKRKSNTHTKRRIRFPILKNATHTLNTNSHWLRNSLLLSSGRAGLRVSHLPKRKLFFCVQTLKNGKRNQQKRNQFAHETKTKKSDWSPCRPISLAHPSRTIFFLLSPLSQSGFFCILLVDVAPPSH